MRIWFENYLTYLKEKGDVNKRKIRMFLVVEMIKVCGED
jgi:hypothetical protein